MFFNITTHTLISILSFHILLGKEFRQNFRLLKNRFFQGLFILFKTDAPGFHRKRFSRMVRLSLANRIFAKSQKLSQAQLADFELLAAYPVDRANPPLDQRLRFLKSRQGLLQERVWPGMHSIRRTSAAWLRPAEIVALAEKK
jgi:hypothetical protein